MTNLPEQAIGFGRYIPSAVVNALKDRLSDPTEIAHMWTRQIEVGTNNLAETVAHQRVDLLSDTIREVLETSLVTSDSEFGVYIRVFMRDAARHLAEVVAEEGTYSLSEYEVVMTLRKRAAFA